MPRHKFTDAQIAMVVREIENGARVQEVSRKLGVTENTLYNWKRKYAGMGSTEIRRLRQLEEENARLKKLVAELSLDKVMLQDILSKKD
jgi:putative transposase